MPEWLTGLAVAALIACWFAAGMVALGFVPAAQKWLKAPGHSEQLTLWLLAGLAATVVWISADETLLGDLRPEVIGIALTVVVIDGLGRRRANREFKEATKRQLASRSNDFALDAARIVKEKGWHDDGSLRQVVLTLANLRDANLWGFDLRGPELIRTNLQGAILNYINLEDANLSVSNLEGASLWGANLERARLAHANLRGAELGQANLLGTNLEQANLHGTNLKDAILWGANLENANLRDSNLQGAFMWGVNLKSACLEGANLEGVIHAPPDEVGPMVRVVGVTVVESDAGD